MQARDEVAEITRARLTAIDRGREDAAKGRVIRFETDDQINASSPTCEPTLSRFRRRLETDSRLPAEVRSRLDTMIEKGFQIAVGDANGADRAIQRYLADKSYPNVLVHCMKDHRRNNVGKWPTREIDAPRGARGFGYYSLKDRAMADAAQYGLMRWDGKSKGTVNNVVNLCRDREPVVVYVATMKEFRTIKTPDDLRDLLAQGDSESVERIVSELHLSLGLHPAAG